MDPEDPFRASRMNGSRLPAPAARGPPKSTTLASGLSELSESQHNARAQSNIPPQSSLKRAVPQPAVTSEPKRKPLSQRAGEYPPKTIATTSSQIRPNVQPTTLVGAAAGIKRPGNFGFSRQTSTNPRPQSNNFAASVGPDSRGPYSRPKTSQANSSHARSLNAKQRGYDARPQTSYGQQPPAEEDRGGSGEDCMAPPPPPEPSLSTTKSSRSRTSGILPTSEMPRLREVSRKIRDRRSDAKKIQNTANRNQVVPSSKGTSPPSTPEHMPHVTFTRGGKSPSKTPRAPRPSYLGTFGIPNTPSQQMFASSGILQGLAELQSQKTPSLMSPGFLTKHSNVQNFSAVDVEKPQMEQEFYTKLNSFLEDTAKTREGFNEAMGMYKKRVDELQTERDDLTKRNAELNSDIHQHREEALELRRKLEDAEWRHKNELESLRRSNEHARDDLQRSLDTEVERMRRTQAEELEALRRHYNVELEEERREKARQMEELDRQMGTKQQDLDADLQKKDNEISELRYQLEKLKADVDRETTLKSTLQTSLAEMSAANVTMEAKMNSLRSQIEFLESDSKAQSDSFADMEARLQEANRIAEEAKQKLIKEETERRVLFNKYQELKGNIRVMCRVRPVLDDSEGSEAKITFPDEKTSAKIGIQGPEEKSSLGQIIRKEYPFEYDRVFDTSVRNEEVFGEISQLVQSALDGYNVCIFCYGQTGSGKTFTMSSQDGMIPRATHMIYDTITKLREKSWEYTMEGSFIEVYNEELHDLLSPHGKDSKKLEVRHDEVRKQTTVANCKTVRLDSAASVEAMLAEAQNNRSVAATKANERSSRSHSVFILRLVGENSATGERCEGTLNLVDLAGSERLKHSQAEGERMRETQNINKSLSCLGDVIDALGRGTAHVPYRNSKLTHLLQYSLGGNSKTLMFVMVSPLEAHLKETLTSLRFAAKVHNTHIGTAKATKKIKDRAES